MKCMLAPVPAKGPSELNHADRQRHAQVYQLHRDLLALRRNDPRFSEQRKGGLEGAVLGAEAFLLRFLDPAGKEDRWVIINLGRDLHLNPAPEPLLAPPWESRWEMIWSSEDPVYGGDGTPSLETEEDNWRITGKVAVILKPASHANHQAASIPQPGHPL